MTLAENLAGQPAPDAASGVLRRRRDAARRHAFGGAGAVVLNGAVIAALTLSIAIPRLVEPPAMTVSLVRPFALAAPRRAEVPRSNAASPPRAHPRAAAIVGPERPAPSPLAPSPADARALDDAVIARPGPLSEGLRTGPGCADPDGLGLTPDEREACRKHLRALRAGAPTYAVGPSDPAKRLFLDRQAEHNAKRRRELEGPPSHPMGTCEQGRWQNLGFSCPP